MAIYPFYTGATIDDALRDCGKIIIVDCAGLHTYIDPCDLLATCMIAWPPINWCSMIPGVVPTQPGIPSAASLRILRVNAAGNCVEFVPPNVAFTDTDRLVTVTVNDTTPGNLFSKIVSCDSNLVIDVLNSGGNEILRLCATAGCKDFLCLTDTPNAYIDCGNGLTGRGYVRFNQAVAGGGLEFDCDYTGFRGTRYISGVDAVVPQVINDIQFHSFDMGKYQGNPDMNVGSVNVMGLFFHAITILKDGMYFVWLKGNVQVNDGVQSMRLTIVADNPALLSNDHSALFCVDSKFGAAVPFPMPPAGQTFRFYNMGGSTLIKLRAGDRIGLGVRIDSNAGTNMPAQVILYKSALGSGNLTSGTDASSHHPGVSFGVAWYSEQMHGADHNY